MGNKIKIASLSLFILVASLGIYSNARARVRRNEVKSEHIQDGEVKNRDIAPSAVTTDKIADAEVQNADIAPSAVTTDKIADAEVTSSDIAPGAVTTNKIANDAVSTDKIADNAVGGAKILNGTITNADISSTANISKDKLAPGSFAGAYVNIVNVSLDGNGDFSDPVAAMDSITDNSINTTYLLKIMPGTYDVGANTVQMKPYVDIEGSGENVTRITGTIGSGAADQGVVQGADNAELRQLTVENTGGDAFSIAIHNGNASPSIVNVTAMASGGTSYNFGIHNGTSSAVMSYVTVIASGGSNNRGINNDAGSPGMTNVSATASGASSGNFAIYNYNGTDATMNHVTASASGGSFSYAINNQFCSPLMNNVIAGASNATNTTTGVYNYSNAGIIYPVMRNVIAKALGGGGAVYSYGVYNDHSSTTMTNVTASAAGATQNRGVASYGGSTVRIANCTISGSSNTLINSGATTTSYVTSSKLDGAAAYNSGTLTCASITDENYTFYPSTCP